MKPTSTQVTIVLGLVAVGVVYYIGKKALEGGTDALRTGIKSVTPWDSQNIVNRGVNGVVSGLTGREETLGGWLHDTFSSLGDAVEEANRPRNPAAPQISTPSGLNDVVSNNTSGMNFNYF